MSDSSGLGIRIFSLTKVFGSTIAVDDLTLDVRSGELFTFLGPNAAGKTTTIKILTGLLKPTKGKVAIGQYDIQDDYLQAKRFVGYIPDLPYLYEKLTGREFLRFIGQIYEMPEGKAYKQSEYLLKLFGLIDWGDCLIESFSHGMRQKLVYAAALLHDPKVLIIDEPMVGLDPKSTHLVKDILKEKSRQGITIFMSTHTLSLAEELSDRAGIIDKGRLIALGTIEQLRHKAGIGGKLEEVFLRLTSEE